MTRNAAAVGGKAYWSRRGFDESATCSPRQGLGHESSGTTPSNHVAFSQQLFVRAQDCIPRHFEIARQDSCRRQPSARRELSGIDRGFERAIENIVARKTWQHVLDFIGSSLVPLNKRNLALGERHRAGYCLSIRGHENLSPVGANRERTSRSAGKSRGGIEEAERLSAMWYFYAAIGPAIWALLNHLDKYLLDRFFRHGATGAALAVFTGFAGVLVACGILLFDLSRVASLEPRQALLVTAAGPFLVASYIRISSHLNRPRLAWLPRCFMCYHSSCLLSPTSCWEKLC